MDPLAELIDKFHFYLTAPPVYLTHCWLVVPVDFCLSVPRLSAFFALLISLGQQGLIILRLKSGPTFSIWPKLGGILVRSTKSLQSLV